MKKLFSIFLLICTLSLLSTAAMSQITVSGSTGANGSYTDLTGAAGAFFAINSSAQTGNNITISVTADVLAEPGLTSLNANDWTTLTISPSGGAARTISGSVAGTLIDLNGADNLTIDGLNTGGNSLTISNTATGGVNTIRFIADATNNSVTNCTILGSTTFRIRGVILFSTGTTTGNDNNSINNCVITSAGSNLPINGINSIGTSATIENNQNTINACNISDYFKADSVTNGIILGTGNSGWTITNNRLFQTANRIYTSSFIHNGINITTGSGYTITGNVIGYANSSGTGSTNMIGMTSGSLGGTFPSSYTSGGTANATRYVAINCAFASGGAVSSIQNNTIGGFALYTSSGATTTNGILCGINVTAGNANIGTVTGNTISSMYTATTTTGGAIVGIFAQCSNTGSNAISVQNNNIHSLNAMGNTPSNCGGITGINISSSGNFTVINNTVGNATNPNLRMGNLTDGGGNLSNTGTTFGTASGFGGFRGIQNSFTSANIIVSNNIIRNASLNSTSASNSSVYRGIEHTGSTGATMISENSITNITAAVASTSLSTGALSGIGIYISSSATGISVTQNTISGLSLTNTTTSGTNVAGISIASANTLSVSKNIIYDLSNASNSNSFTTPGSASGIFIRNGAISPMNIFNNMITLGNSQTTNTCFIGIWGNHGQLNNPVTNIYYNSIYITGTVTSGDIPSFGYLRGDLSTTARTPAVDIRNNLFNNDRAGGTGKHYAIANNYGATASNTGWGINASNFNILNSASSSTVGYWNSDQTLASWRTASGSDVLSLTGVPVTFTNIAAGDLHLNMGLTPTQLESGGVVIASYTTDIDNQTRPGPAGSVNGGAWAPDFGADEFDGVPNDLTAPLITYNLLLNSSCLISRDLSADIFDGLGVNTAPGTKPRVYYKKSTNLNTMPVTNDNTTDGWKYAEASNSSSPFNFTLDYSIVFGGVASGDVLEYFVIAQDINTTPNVGVNTGVFTIAPSSVALAALNFPVSSVNSFSFTTGLSGIVTIGATGTYTTLTDAGGLFEAINANGIGSNLTAEIIDPSITETGLTALNSIALGCGSGLTLTIKPASGVTTILTGSNATALIDLNSADYVIFDGSNNGTSSKDMTIRNTGTGAAIRFINGASNDTLRNSYIESQNASTTGGTVFFSTSTGTTGNSSNVISNCDLRDRSDIAGVPANAIFSNGSAGLLNSANKISGCNIFNFTNAGVLVAAAGAGDGWVINPSSFYQTSSRTTRIIFISILGGSGHSVVNNYIGGTAPNAGGSFFSTSNDYTGIDLSVGTGTVTSVQGNTVMNIRSTGGNFGCNGININTGDVNVGNVTGNTIGSSDSLLRLEMTPGGSNGISSRSPNTINISNNLVNNIHMLFQVESSGILGIRTEATVTGTYTIMNNTVTNMTSKARGGPPLLGGSANMNGIYVFVRGICTVRGNTISNIGNTYTLAGLSPSNINGMNLLLSLPGTVIENNVITGLYGSNTVTGNNAEGIIGFSTSQNANGTVSNNVISLNGYTGASDKKVIGISEQSGNSAVMNYYYNSVHIYGTSSASNNTYAFNRALAQTILSLRNNAFINSRVAATGFNLALSNEIGGVNTANGWPASASNYNALYTLNSASTCRWGTSTNFDLAGFQSVTGGDSYTVFGNPGYTSNTDLLPDGTNNNSWTLKGNGIAISTIGNDIVGTPRSTSIPTGGTDIGAYEFSSTVQPPAYNNATAATGLYKFIHALDTMAAINVTTLGTLADINVQYYSGENPPGLATTSYMYGNVYWEIYPTDALNSGYTYDVTLRYSPALLGTIPNENVIKVAKNTFIDTQYVPFTAQGFGPGEYQIDTSKNLITVYGLTGFSRFILTDSDIPLPVELASFTSSIKGRDVNLNWTTSSETNNSGFEVERKSVNGSWMKIGNVSGHGTTTNVNNYSYTDKNLSTGKYEFRLKQIDYNGNHTYFNLSNEVLIGAPDKFELSQNYPNPFNPTTKINYSVPVDGRVSMKLYDISGREIFTLVNDVKTAGYYTVTLNASNLASGTYFYRINAEGNGQKFVETKKMVVIK